MTVGHGAPRALLVHGNDLSGPFYEPLARRLAARGLPTRLVTLPGFHGEPPLPRPGWNAMVNAVLDALPGRPATLIGHSMGALMAVLAAARRPAVLARLVLLEPAIFPTWWLARAGARRYLETVVRGQSDRFVNWNGVTRRVADERRYPREAIELYLEVRRTSDLATREALFRTLPSLYPLPLGRVQVPTLVVMGSESSWRARAMAWPVARALGARSVTAAGAAHFLVHEADDEVARHVATFVESTP